MHLGSLPYALQKLNEIWFWKSLVIFPLYQRKERSEQESAKTEITFSNFKNNNFEMNKLKLGPKKAI